MYSQCFLNLRLSDYQSVEWWSCRILEKFIWNRLFNTLFFLLFLLFGFLFFLGLTSSSSDDDDEDDASSLDSSLLLSRPSCHFISKSLISFFESKTIFLFYSRLPKEELSPSRGMGDALNPIWPGGDKSSPLKIFFSIASQVLPIWFWNFASFPNFYPGVFCKKNFFQNLLFLLTSAFWKLPLFFFQHKI